MKTKFHLPIVKKIILKNISIFSKAPNIEVELSNGVFCLAGANGLGKSTFLLAINFGITGIIPDPSRKFLSMEKYYNDSLRYSSKFFNGRILEKDREKAEVSLEILVGKYKYHICRGLFEPKKLRKLEITSESTFETDFQKLTTAELHEYYTKSITEHTGLESFDQLVFLQHFVMTFDERRDLLFWNERVLERCLYLAFGVSPEEAKKADNLRKEYEDADSYARNFKWEATQINKRIEELDPERDNRPKESELTISDVKKEYQNISDELDELRKQVTIIESDLRDTDLKITELSSNQSYLRKEYENIFNMYLASDSVLHHHPIITNSINDLKCGLCGSEGDKVIAKIQKVSLLNRCPLCDSVIIEDVTSKEKNYLRLQEIDSLLLNNKSKLEEMHLLKDRYESELITSKSYYDKKQNSFNNFEKENRKTLEAFKINAKQNKLELILEKYIEQMNEALKKQDKAILKRDKKGCELKELQNRLERQYAIAENNFVPRFKELAKSFLGINLDIKLESRKGLSGGIKLLLDVNNTPRRQSHQLSESQRFFVDIALRMAIAQFISDIETKATLYIDTPEGSLDIAYESRAGEMFAKFVEGGYHIIMTANINSSQLLVRLATRCKNSKMKLLRMTSWTDLSEVQIQEEDLFEKAFTEIEDVLTELK